MLLGVSQGLTWSTTVIMKIDLVGPARRGLAMGFNEAAGYGAVAVTALATGQLAEHFGLRPAPFLLGAAYAALGLGLSVTVVRETRRHAHLEAGSVPVSRPSAGPPVADRFPAARPSTAEVIRPSTAGVGWPSTADVVWRTSVADRSLSAASQAGLVNNLNDALAWGVFPLVFAAGGLDVARIGLLGALYPLVWGLGQTLTGWWSDHAGRKHLITAGMLLQAAAIAAVAAGDGFATWAAAQVLLGIGTALVYPTLLAVIGDVAHPAWRARAVGVYRLWRDAGFAVGALLAGLIADQYGLDAAVWTVAALTAASGGVVAVRMRETLPSRTL
jgi:MFS family permease